MPKKEDPVYQVSTADAQSELGYGLFHYGEIHRKSYIQRVFNRRLESVKQEFFPGLVLQDGKGDIWKPVVRVELVHIETGEVR
jgi:hypothetical protein